MNKILILVSILIVSPLSSARELIYEGYPMRMIQIDESGSQTTLLNAPQSVDYKVRIEEKDGNYFWASRGDVELIPSRSGFYITYISVTGSGYIRVLAPEARTIFKELPAEDQAKQFLYFEHLVHQMGSITYHGR